MIVRVRMELSSLERRERIVDQLAHGAVSVTDLVRQFGVSEMTVRRDLAALEHEGKLVRVHGGAISSRRLAYEYSFKVKEAHSVEAKRHIGETAAELIRPMDVVFVDTGSTALAVARALARHNPRVMITSNLAAAMEMVGTNIRILVAGGELSPHSPDLYGEWTLQILSTINVDIAFFGCDAVDPATGFYASDTRSAAVARLMMSRSQRKYLVADSTKFGRRAMCLVAGFAELSGVVTDRGLAEQFRKPLDRMGAQVWYADVSTDVPDGGAVE
jgi:DeoR/GlpR family transcriptional regulator of sugar metabolism